MIGDQCGETSQSLSKNDSAVTELPKTVGKKPGFKKRVKSSHKLHKKMLSNSGASQPEEIITVPLSGRFKGRGSGCARKKGDKVVSYTCDQGLNYKPGDCVYLENSQADRPYFICSIQSLRLTKRGTLVAHIKWYFRFYEVPESVYLPLVQDRHTEDDSGREVNSKQSVVRSRELFTSDATDTYPVSALRGKCRVLHYQEISGAKDFTPNRDSFFYVLGYNPETKRLATTQGEIRVGPSHQARLPEYKPNVGPPQMPELCAKHEDLKWQPQTVMDEDLVMFLRAARSIAAFAGMCDEGSTEAGCQAASMDDTTMNAMDILHGHKYETGKALQALVRSPAMRSIHKKWTEEDAKRFVRGLRLHGKNFFKIRKELLPHRETGDLVEYYYFWKKTPAAVSNRPHRRHRRSGLKRPTVRSSNQPSGDYLDQSSASEVSDETEDSDGGSRDSTYACRRCFATTSKDWHHAGKDKTLLCTECRLHFKKYGEDRPIDTSREPPAFLFKPVKDEDEEIVNGKPIMRTRRNNISAGNNGKKKDRLSTSSPDNVDSPVNGSQKSSRKSPSAVSTCSNSSSDIRDKITDSPSRGSKRQLVADEDETLLKKKKLLSDSDSAVESDSSGSGNDENGNEGDLENNQDDLSSSSPPTTPSPTDFKLNKDVVKPEAQHPKPQSPLFHPQLTDSHLHTLTPTANQNRSPSPLANQMNSESLSTNQISSGSLPTNPIHLQQEQSGSPVPPVTPDTTNPADSSRSYDQSSNHVHSLKQKDTPLNPYHLPVSRTFPLDQLDSRPHHPTNQEQQSVHLSNPMSLYSDEQSTNQSHPGGRRSSSPSPQSLPNQNEKSQKTLPPTSLPLTSPLSIFPSIYPPVTGPHISHTLAPSPQPIPGLVPIKSEPLSPLLPPTWEETIRREVEKSASRETSMDVKPVIPLPSETRADNRDDIRPLFPHTEAGPPSLIPSSSVPSQGPQGPMRTSTPNLNPSALPILPSQPAIKGPPPTIPLLAMPPDGALGAFRPDLIGSSMDKEEVNIAGSDSEREGTPSPGPDPTPCNREIHKSKSAIFLQILNRGSNSCSRCDLIFRPLPDSKLSKKREDRDKKSSHPAPKEEPKPVKRLETPTPPRAHSSEQRMTPISTSQPHTPYPERHTPRSMYTDTPALRQLSEYARPHAMNQDIPRSMPYNLPPHVDPMLMGYRLGMYAPGSRERLELELEMDKRERDARERDLRERELREMEIREKMKAEMEMKPPGTPASKLGLERLMPPGANPLDPQWLELQRRFGGGMPSGSMVPIQGSGHPGNPHIPGVYPPASLASDLMAREREKQDRLGLPPNSPFLMGEPAYQREMERASAERFQAERIASDPVLRMQMAAAMHAHMHTHAHSHTHLHVHPQDGLPGNGSGPGPSLPPSPTFPQLYLPFNPGADPMSSIIGQSAAAVAMAAAAAGSSSAAGSSNPHPLSCLPPGMVPPHVLPGSREHELLQRELYSRMYVDPAVAHQLSAQAHHEALQRQLALDRERYGAGHLPPH